MFGLKPGGWLERLARPILGTTVIFIYIFWMFDWYREKKEAGAGKAERYIPFYLGGWIVLCLLFILVMFILN